MRNLRTQLLWGVYSICSLLLSIWLAWHLCAKVNFLYPFWYAALNIDQTVSQTSPRHLYKKQFGKTTSKEHHRLFAEIVNSVQNQGKGLADIKFYDEQGNVLGQLLTEKEIIHLKDVATLVNQLNWVNLILFIACLLLVAMFFLLRISMPKLRSLFVSVGAILGSATLLIILVGPTRVFYWLHPIVFPADHQWFFYYEESLMSTLMKAPTLFAPLGLQLVLLGLLIWGMHLVMLNKLRIFK